MRCIDLRRDTLTLPTPKMVEAAFHAKLDDSVYNEDPIGAMIFIPLQLVSFVLKSLIIDMEESFPL